jgi:multiple sugar transport system substrate-binding protein
VARSRRIKGVLAIVPAFAATMAVGCGSDDESGSGTTLTWFIFNEPSGSPQAAADKCEKESNGAYNISFEFLPADADGQREQLVRRLGAEDSSVDLIGMDVIWTGEFANAGWITPFPQDVADKVTADVFPSVVKTGEFEGKLYAAPLWSNTQLLWYRTDRVPKAPKTWDEVIDEGVKLGPDKGLIEVQADKYEGLVVWFNQLLESAGGHILAGPEEIDLQQEPTERALEVMGKLSTSEAADPAITTSEEDPARLAFEAGSAAFQINYPFVYPSAKENAPDIYKNMRWAPYPGIVSGKPAKAPIGGINWGVGAYTKHPQEAFAAAACMRNPENEKEAAIKGGLPPTLESLYSDPELIKAYPFAALIRKQLATAAVRPVTPAYADVSLAVAKAVSPPTSIETNGFVNTLRGTLKDALNSQALL